VVVSDQSYQFASWINGTLPSQEAPKPHVPNVQQSEKVMNIPNNPG
ncbi:hypothetical protein CEXT_630361, partial [Caerostris extrusa]